MGSLQYFLVSLLLAYFVVATKGLECPVGQSKCKDGKQCAFSNMFCKSGFGPFCDDKSDHDQDFCRARACLDHEVKCGDGMQCIPKMVFCDLRGIAWCDDKTDENPIFCKENSCPAGYSKCADGIQCLNNEYFCDGVHTDCKDGSDEQGC